MQPLNPKLDPLTTAARERLFGKFGYKAAPSVDNRERILLTDSWAKENLVKTELPFSIAIALGADQAWFHRRVLPRFLELVAEWDEADVSRDIVQWGGSYAPRFIRGSQATLSAHSWGSAFDINVQQNGLGRPPTPLGQVGSVLRLVPIAERLGWYWGGRMSRCDGMHFELAKL